MCVKPSNLINAVISDKGTEYILKVEGSQK